jgi:uncharacterized UPF0160 family protein
MSFFKKDSKKKLVTHSSTFHADDIFATASLSILLDGNIEVARSRDPEVILSGDYVYDVGGEYDPSRNRFDHHQEGGAGARENGIPYAAFGLVWKTYGGQICGSQEIADRLDEKLVQAIDAGDNGVSVYTLKEDVAPYLIEDAFSSFRPTYNEDGDFDTPFLKMVDFAKEILVREIHKIKSSVDAATFVESVYEQAPDKRLIVLDVSYPWGDVLGSHPEPLYVIYPKSSVWHLQCVAIKAHSFENRKSLPQEWAGKLDGAMAEASGVVDATFCHNGRFLAVAKSKEGAIKLAEKALLA